MIMKTPESDDDDVPLGVRKKEKKRHKFLTKKEKKNGHAISNSQIHKSTNPQIHKSQIHKSTNPQINPQNLPLPLLLHFFIATN
jgi:hypothetical protein